MNGLIKGPKDFWAGLLYLTIGGLGVVLARDYGMGDAARMGPGYFPTVLGALLVIFGAASLGRSLFRRGEAIGAIAWKPIVLIVGATVAFAYLIKPAGLVLALTALILISASASSRFRFEWKATAAMFGLIAFCSLVFVKGLGIPLPLFGTWFGG
ncbi:tripartite tricarboxylate transporter TctB family protein [Denitromonas iodatirespirans]|uniref:Tripartite tricarboxylate transporter TctB family protein n=1 Tax=Denitromonas iodatirespirans TaxID=2795389 RepID=A0A944DAQ7_DENI1|nr:tripartite tricarboxylate transporter TctB family protein [Denitromonas iodatirespirans]MBT0961636.1 tripartite tricarboxylate transporter TctB family protein [Denitromonas iodatirespirans]